MIVAVSRFHPLFAAVAPEGGIPPICIGIAALLFGVAVIAAVVKLPRKFNREVKCRCIPTQEVRAKIYDSDVNVPEYILLKMVDIVEAKGIGIGQTNRKINYRGTDICFRVSDIGKTDPDYELPTIEIHEVFRDAANYTPDGNRKVNPRDQRRWNNASADGYDEREEK